MRPKTVGNCRASRPDVVIVDSEAGAAEATAFALEHGLPLLHISVRDRELRLFRPLEAANTGLELVESLSRSDLEGTIQYSNALDGGGIATVTFPLTGEE